jgi:hypothetical protein
MSRWLVLMLFLECVVGVVMGTGLRRKMCPPSRHRILYKKQLVPRRDVTDPHHTPSPSTPTHPFISHSPHPTLLFLGLLAGRHHVITLTDFKRFRLVDWRGVRNGGGGTLQRRHFVPTAYATCFFDLTINNCINFHVLFSMYVLSV